MKWLFYTLLAFTLRSTAQNYLFYLHGRIVEIQGAKAIDTINGFGAYQYEEIINAFKNEKFVVLSEIRKNNTDVKEYAHKIVKQIDSLFKKNVSPERIAVVGASKGSIIAMYVSTFLKNDKVNFIFMAACHSDNLQRYPDINYCGNILSIYEKTDDAGTCSAFKQRSKNVSSFKEIELDTRMKHGFLYKPLKDWIEPAVKWANNDHN